uniref:Uncharacterized protein n=1 Tax=Amphimedon queenslandica TaxID=400682 RepID=A0A1X7SKU8_AMPQE
MEGMEQCRNEFEKRDHANAVWSLQSQDPNVLYRNERDLLYYSIRNGWLDIAKDLITNYHFDPKKYYKGDSYLYIAAKANQIDIVEYLIKEHGCDPMMGTRYNRKVPILHYAAREGLLNVLKCMVMNINGHIMDEQIYDAKGRTVLCCAVKHTDVVKFLINECNCDIMSPDKYGVPFLHHVASKGLLDVLKCMVMNINGHIMDERYCDKNGQTILHLALKHIDVVKYLINECNCDIMSPDKYGVPFLHYVASEGLLDVLKCMVMNINGHIMDEQYRDKNGRTILHLALKHIDVVKYLINECNCDIMFSDKYGIPFLHYVASEGLLDVLKCMVMNINSHIMDEQYCDNTGRTILHLAVKHIDIVNYLINECNCDIMSHASERILDVLKCM